MEKVKCPSCGSFNVEQVDENLYQCPYCGKTFNTQEGAAAMQQHESQQEAARKQAEIDALPPKRHIITTIVLWLEAFLWGFWTFGSLLSYSQSDQYLGLGLGSLGLLVGTILLIRSRKIGVYIVVASAIISAIVDHYIGVGFAIFFTPPMIGSLFIKKNYRSAWSLLK